ncbi:MAG: TetR/AcrR family transcriptional regulator [Halomonas sp.]|uniref:TetR/AcrR family transcriptional regulator n=1 Tax=Halomonas sp. TaxID=1486246 RepID=UPI003F91414E
MNDKTAPRPGGRSARVQTAVHSAVREIQKKFEHERLTVPSIAARAGVNPTTIYRRWGTLDSLLADVALERMQPEQIPEDFGNLHDDLANWMEAFIDEMASDPGRAMLREVLGTQGHACTGKCDNYIRQQIEVITKRADDRREKSLAVDEVVQFIVAPLMYRMLFSDETSKEKEIESLIRTTISNTE